MALHVVHIVSTCLQQGFDIFNHMLDATGLKPLYLAMFAMLVIVVYLLTPYVRGVSSDMARDVGKKHVDGKASKGVNSRKGGKR